MKGQGMGRAGEKGERDWLHLASAEKANEKKMVIDEKEPLTPLWRRLASPRKRCPTLKHFSNFLLRTLNDFSKGATHSKQLFKRCHAL